MTETRENIYDVIIAGGGPAGSSLAIRLATAGLRVLLAEQKQFPREKLCGEFISPECLAHFSELGVLDRMLEPGGTRLTATVFYTVGGRGTTVPSDWFGHENIAALGLSRAEMDQRLLDRARAVGAEIAEASTTVGLITEDEKIRGVRIHSGDSEREIRASLVIDATGRGRALARQAESETGGHHESSSRAPFVAFKAHLVNARIDPAHCEIYVYRGGYGGVNGVENGLFNHCFIVRTDLVRKCGQDAERVVREVVMRNRRAHFTLAAAEPVTPWLAVSLPWYGPRDLAPVPGLLAVGDAAAFIDPFTGSGMLMALESSQIAARKIAEWFATAADFTQLELAYRTAYRERFRTRLRVSGWLRHAAFLPGAAAALVYGLNLCQPVRRRLARATRGENSVIGAAS